MNLLKTIMIPLVCAAWANLTAQAQSNLMIKELWQIQGTPLGTERALDPYLALTQSRLFISGSIEIDRNRRQVIQVFDGQTGSYVQTIEDPTGTVFAGLGDVLAANEEFLVTSTYRGATAGSGSLQVFDTATGEHLRTIENPRAGDSSFFGQLPIAITGSRAMAGIALSDDNQSTVWIFDLATGDVVLTIDEPDDEGGFLSNAERTIFGFGKALSSTHALISARQKSLGDLRGVGAAFLFDAKTGDLLQTFRPEDPQVDMFFGTKVALTDSMAFVEGSRNAGPMDWPIREISAYDLQTGALKYRLQDPYVPQTAEAVVAGQQGSGFGFDFVISNGLLIVGMPDLTLSGKRGVGGFQIYDANTGERLMSYEHAAGTQNENLGYALVANGTRFGIVSTPEVASFRKVTRFIMYELER
ncbi:MAG: hypothetical protein AAF557_00320 [Pseudomonadota bacterium]